MKTKKLNLNELKVESFVTSLEGKDAQTLKGGGGFAFLLGTAIGATIVVAVATIHEIGVAVGKSK